MRGFVRVQKHGAAKNDVIAANPYSSRHGNRDRVRATRLCSLSTFAKSTLYPRRPCQPKRTSWRTV